MLTAQSPISCKQVLLRPKTGRQPLQQLNSPINFSANTPLKPNLKFGWIENVESNKENPNLNRSHSDKKQKRAGDGCGVAETVEWFDASLADELIAIREKIERLRSDKEKTEKMLRERDLVMEMLMKELDQRGQVQKVLEIEVDRLFRLNELRSLCMRVTPIRSLREKEEEKIKQDEPQEIKPQKMEELEGESSLPTPCSETESEK